MILFLPPIINEYQLRESNPSDFQQIQQEEGTFHEDVIVSLPKILDTNVELEKVSIEEEHEKIKKIIIMVEKDSVVFKEEEISRQSTDILVCSKMEFVTKPYEEIEVYIVEFKTDDERKSYYLEKDKIKIWKKVVV